jgi:hypothetical protein
MNEQNQLTAVAKRRPGRALLWLGMLVALAGLAIYIVLFNAKVLVTPWYAPILASIGVALLLLALVRARSIWRWAALVLFTFFAAAQWLMLLVVLATPAYTGPVKAGQPFPEFSATLADGSSFTQNDLKGDQNTAMVFYRGWW